MAIVGRHAAALRVWRARSSSQPQLLLLDEPFASVDAQTRIDLQDMVMEICRRMSLSTLLVTHDIDEAVFMADKVVVLSTRPAHVVEEIAIDLPRPRDQLATKESPEFLAFAPSRLHAGASAGEKDCRGNCNREGIDMKLRH